MKRPIDADAAIDHFRRIIDATNTDSGYNEGFIDALEFCISTLSTMPTVEPLADAEQRIFIEAMWREKDVCRAVDKEFPDAKVNLTDVCREIVRKVKGALWK